MMRQSHHALVFVLDDDTSVRDGIGDLIESAGWEAELFASPQSLMARMSTVTPHCIILDLRMPGADGIEVQARLVELGHHVPVVFVTGHGDIPTSVRAMKAGAMEFLTKPFREDELLAAVTQAVEAGAVRRVESESRMALQKRFESLTPRESDVFWQVVSGKLNKQAAAALGISEITTKLHRGQVMRKMRAPSFADLVRMAEKLGPATKGTWSPPAA